MSDISVTVRLHRLRDRIDSAIELLERLDDFDHELKGIGEIASKPQAECLQSPTVNGAAKRKQAPKRELGVPKFCTNGRPKSIEVCREMGEPFTVADLARQSGLALGSASNALSRWQQRGWVQGVQGSWTRTPSFPASDNVVKSDSDE